MYRDSDFRGGFDRGGFIAGFILGAGVMYILDPNRGAKRRSYVRDKMVRGMHGATWYAGKQARNMRNHITGTIAETWASIRDRRRDFPNDVLRDRVFAQIGHVVTHPGSLDVSCEDGHVIVSGPVLEGEAFKIEQRLLQTRGVKSYDLRVEEHPASTNEPGLQGRSSRRKQAIREYTRDAA